MALIFRLLHFSDLHPVDAELNEISRTMTDKAIDANLYSFYKMAFKDIISGWTLIINKKLIVLSLTLEVQYNFKSFISYSIFG